MSLRRTLRWRPVDGAGLEHVELIETADGIRADSVVIGSFEGLDFGARYRLELAPDWTFRTLALERTDGARLDLQSDGRGSWRLNDGAAPGLDGCIDIDIGVTPLTNTLPIRRLALRPGSAHHLRMAWVPLDSLVPFTDEQVYTRLDATRIHYAAADGSFEATLTVDDAGFVVDYPGLYRRA